MQKSCYEHIRDSLVNGILPEGFHLQNKSNGGMVFADGAMDGMMVYHRAPGHELSDEQRSLIELAIDQISNGEFYGVEETVWKIADDIGPIDAHEYLRQYIEKNANRLSLSNIINYAVVMITRSSDPNTVKIALTMMSIFELGDDLKEYIRTLGLSDEFTLFVATAMDGWENDNQEWFNLVQKVHGWGRIHLINRLRPDSEEIRRWIRLEGVHNTVLSSYSAIDCWVKGDVENVLLGALSKEELNGIRDIIQALLDEGPVKGISCIKDVEKYIHKFLCMEKGTELDDVDKATISEIYQHFSECTDIVQTCHELL